MSLSFVRKENKYGTSWDVLWNGKKAALIIETGYGGERYFMLRKITDQGYQDLGNQPTIEEAKAYFENKVKGAQNEKTS